MEFREEFMAMAFQEAASGSSSGHGGPFGAVIVKNGEVIGKGHNRVLLLNDPTAHAEIMAIRDACSTVKDFQLEDCVLYSTCEPCPMCLGAIYWARPSCVFYGSSRHDAAAVGFDDAEIYKEVNIPGEQRKIPMHYRPDSKIRELMENWVAHPGRQLY
jgi:guanine deaminase